MESPSSSPQIDSKQKKISEIFSKATKSNKAEPQAKPVEASTSSEVVIDLTRAITPVDSILNKLNEDLAKLIEIKLEEGHQPLLDILDHLTSGKKDKTPKPLEVKENEPKKKYRPGPKFGKFN